MLSWELIGPSIVAGILVMLTHAPLGHEVLRRGVIFIDLAIAQFAGLGLITAKLLGYEDYSIEFQLTILGCALSGALLMAILERFVRHQEAMIGVLFVLAATAAILLASQNPSHASSDIKNLLSRDVLFIDWADLYVAGALALVLFTIKVFLPKLLRGPLFYVCFAFALTASIQHVGMYLVFASLIIPAYAVMRTRYHYLFAVLIGCLAYIAGLVTSSYTDMPAGALTVWFMAIFGLLGFLLSSAMRKR